MPAPQKPQFLVSCLDGKLGYLRDFLSKNVDDTDSGFYAMDTDVINSAQAFFNPQVAFIDPMDKIVENQHLARVIQGSSLDKKPEAKVVITRHLPMNLTYQGNNLDFAHLFATTMHEILYYRDGMETRKAASNYNPIFNKRAWNESCC